MPSISTFEVRKDDLRTTRASSHDIDPSTLAAGQVLLEIDRFALTANNITYAAFGEKMKYWDFYPAADGWGVIPVWGFATVLASAAGGITTGERFYGYFPMASHALLAVGKSSPAGFHEGTPLRQPLSPVYNQYVRCTADPAYDSTRENEQAVLRPLFFTSWLIADFLADHPRVAKVIYPGRKDHPQAEIIARQMKGGSTLICFDLKGGKKSAYALENNLGIISMSNNLGDSKSLITHPATTTHQRFSEEARAGMGIGGGLLRLSTGLEHIDDLKEDLSRGLAAI